MADTFLNDLITNAQTIKAQEEKAIKTMALYKKESDAKRLAYTNQANLKSVSPRITTNYLENSRQNTFGVKPKIQKFNALANAAKGYDQFAYGATDQAKIPLTGTSQFFNNSLLTTDTNTTTWDARSAQFKKDYFKVGVPSTWYNPVQQEWTDAKYIDMAYKNNLNTLKSSFTDAFGADFSKLSKAQLATMDYSGINALMDQISVLRDTQQGYLDKLGANKNWKSYDPYNSLSPTYKNYATQYGDSLAQLMKNVPGEFTKMLGSANSVVTNKEALKANTIKLLEQFKIDTSFSDKKTGIVQEQAPSNSKQQILNRMSKIKEYTPETTTSRLSPVSQTRPA